MAAKYNVVFLSSIGLIFVALAGPIASLFTSDPAIGGYAVAGLRTVAFGFPLYAYGMVLNSAFNGAGDTWTPTWINLFVFWAFCIPLAALLALPLHRGPRGVFFAMLLTYSVHAIVSAWFFRKGRWKTRRV
jgi:Na+-driven multidrug efflux pump